MYQLKMNSMKNRSIFIGSALVSLLALTYFSACSSSQAKEDEPAANTSLPVTETIQVQKGVLESSFQLPGELIAFQEVDLYAKVSSFVKKLYVDVGSEVKEGELLVTLEAPEIISQVAGAESRLKSQEAIYLASKATYDRLKETSETPGTVSQNDLDIAYARQKSDYAQLDAMKAAYREMVATKDYLEIRAPFDGVISARNVSAGAYVGPAGTGSSSPIFTLQEQKKLRLVVSVPDAYSSNLQNNPEVKFTVKSLIGEKFTAKVSRKAGALDARLRSQRIEMDVYNNDKKLLPGMIAEVVIPMNASDSTYIVPKSAVVNGTEKPFVLRVVNHKAERVTVQTGRIANGSMEVFGALNPGDIIIKTASEEIRNGAAINK